jgi:hypothetical protein
MKVKFIADAFYNGVLTHRKGEIADLKSDMAFRWVKRNIAIFSEEKEVKVPEVKEVESEFPEQLTEEVEVVENEEDAEATPKKRTRRKAE